MIDVEANDRPWRRSFCPSSGTHANPSILILLTGHCEDRDMFTGDIVMAVEKRMDVEVASATSVARLLGSTHIVKRRLGGCPPLYLQKLEAIEHPGKEEGYGDCALTPTMICKLVGSI